MTVAPPSFTPASFGDVAFGELIFALVAGDSKKVTAILNDAPHTATAAAVVGATRQGAPRFFFDEIRHYVYAGDTALHMAAATHRFAAVPQLLRRGADVSARNRRGAQPLHYAADGGPNSAQWNPTAYRKTVEVLLAAGADPDARDKSDVTPLHRAARNRCTPVVEALLEGGADPTLVNGNGSTALDIVGRSTGKSGSGSDAAKAQQARIIELLQAARRPHR